MILIENEFTPLCHFRGIIFGGEEKLGTVSRSGDQTLFRVPLASLRGILFRGLEFVSPRDSDCNEIVACSVF